MVYAKPGRECSYIQVMPAALAFDAHSYAAVSRHRPHQHDELQLSLVVGGAVAETVNGATEYSGALSVVAKNPGVVHADEFGPAGARIVRLTLRGRTLASLIDDPARDTEWRWMHDVRAARPFLRLVGRVRASSGWFGADDADVVDLLAALTARQTNGSDGSPPAWLAQVIDEMRQSWHAGMTVAAVARRAGVHPVYLARCVRRWYGTSVGAELRRLRLRSAAEALSHQRQTVSDVAHTKGYSDEPHLCREFTRTLGLSPGRYRDSIHGLPYKD